MARKTETPVATIRYYESIGLMAMAERGRGGQRVFGATDLARLDFIRSRRALGFSLARIRELLAGAGPGAAVCVAALPVAQEQLARVQAQIARLRQIETELKAQIATCAGDCAPSSDARCLLIPS